MSDTKRLLDIMTQLREPEGGCPWDVEQTFETIAPYTIEEAYEVDDAIQRGDFDALRDELGDLLLQVVFHAQMAKEAGHFDFGAVVEAVSDKLVRRHPHVFGDTRIETADAQTEAWEKQKASERASRGESSVADGLPLGLPALLRARKLISRAARAGFAWPSAEHAAAKLAEELSEVKKELRSGDRARLREEIGDLLIATASLAQTLHIDPEEGRRKQSHRGEDREAPSHAGGDVEGRQALLVCDRTKCTLCRVRRYDNLLSPGLPTVPLQPIPSEEKLG